MLGLQAFPEQAGLHIHKPCMKAACPGWVHVILDVGNLQFCPMSFTATELLMLGASILMACCRRMSWGTGLPPACLC